MFWHALVQVARKEFIQHFRTKRLFMVGALLAITMGLAAVVAPTIFYEEQKASQGGQDFDEDGLPTEYEPDYSEFEPNKVMMFYLAAPILGGFMFIQLMAIILTSDSVCSEWQNRTIFLLLSKPVPRSAFLLGKYAGTVGALSIVILAVVFVCYVAMNLLLPEGDAGDGAAFVAATGILILGAAGFAAFSLFTSTITRSTIMSTLAGLGAWLLVFPVIGSIGFFAAIADEDFREEGQYDWEGSYDACGENPEYIGYGPGEERPNETEIEAMVGVYEACVEPFETAHREYYMSRGLDVWFDYATESQACRELEAGYEENNPRGGENWTHEDDQQWYANNPGYQCRESLWERESDFQQKVDQILQEKWDAPRIDWSRYLSPASTMTIAEDLLRNDRPTNPYDEISLSPQTIVGGADSTPSNQAGAIVALFAFGAVFLAAAVMVVRRRDFE